MLPTRLAQNSRLIFAAAFLVRLAFFLVLFHARPVQKVWSTGLEVGCVASSLASGHGFTSPFCVATGPTAWVAPAYTGLVALLFQVFGAYSSSAAWSVLLLNALFASGTACAIQRAGKRFGKGVGDIAAWVWALSPYAMIMSIKLWETSLSALLVTVGALMYWWLRERTASPRAWAAWGLYWGFTALASPSAAIFFPFLSASVAWRTRSRPTLQLALAALGFCAAISPWVVRNYVQVHAIYPVRSNFGEELWLGNHEGIRKPADESQQPFGDPRELALYRSLGERNFMAAKGRAAVTFISWHPLEFARLTLSRILYFWVAPPRSLWVIISIAAFSGLLFAVQKDLHQALPFIVAMLIYPAIYYVTHADNFQRHPIEPVMILLAVLAACNALTRLREYGRPAKLR